MADNRILFAKRTIEEIKPGSTRLQFYDTKTPGLMLLVTPTGHKSFYLARRAEGRWVKMKLGVFPVMTVEQARDRCAALSGDMARGLDPAAARRRSKSEPTVATLWAAWFKDYAKVHKRESSWTEDERQYKTVLKSLQSRRLSSLTTAEIAGWHRRMGKKRGHYAANRALALLSTMFGSASLLLGWKGINPTKGVRRFSETSRDRFLLPDELPDFFEAIDAEGEPWSDYFRLALFTGARRANLMAMAWSDIDLKAATWTIPRSQFKSGALITLALPAEAMEILERRKKNADGSKWVFPSHGATGHLSEIKEAWKRIIKVSGLTDLRPHDLRRTLGSWQAAAGVSQTVIGKSLGHSAGSSATAIYARLHLDPVRAAVSAATAAIAKAASEKPRKAK